MESDDCVEIIVLDDKKSKTEWTANCNNKSNVRFIELNVKNSKLSRQLPRSNVINDGNQQIVKFGKLQENKNFFLKLPPGAVLLKHDNKSNSHEIQHQQKILSKEEIKIHFGNSNDSTTQNDKRIEKNVKNKKIVEVRRNPTRLSKKNFDKDFVTTRQKLLPTKRKENFSNSESNKRIKLSNTAYMNTRSITKKLDTIGSTTQTPSIYDLNEWKAWPVSGMHERPVYHHEHGLGTQYLDQFIKKNNHNTSDESETEDHDEDFQRLKKLISERIESLDLQENGDKFETDSEMFETIMHFSLHLVLAFSTQISSQEYQTAIQNKLKLLKAKIMTDNQEPASDEKNDKKFENTDNKPTMSAVSPGNICKTKNVSNNTYKVLKFIAARMEPAKCLITPRKAVTNIPNNSVTNIQNNCSKLQDIIRGSSKNALILLKIQDPPKANSKRIENPCPTTNNQFVKAPATNLNWNDSAISNDSTMNITTFYENFIPMEGMDYLQESGQGEKSEPETKNEDQNQVTELYQNKNDSETCEYFANTCQGSESKNCDFQTETTNGKKFDFIDQQKFGATGGFCHKATKTNEIPENGTMEPLDLSTARSKKETDKSKEETAKSKKENLKLKEDSTKSRKENVKSKQEATKSRKETVKAKQDPAKSRDEILKSKKEIVKSKEDISKSKETTSKKVEELISKEDLQMLLENTIILYCIITGVDQEKIAHYIDTLNATENLEWLKEHCT